MTPQTLPRWLAGLLALLAPAAAPAREYSPRVVSPHNADAYSMKTFARHHAWRGLEGDRLAWEVFRHLADRRTGLFPLGREVFEGRDVLKEYRCVRDPVKLINVYGYGNCGILGPVMAGVCAEMDLGRSRTLIIPGWGHVAAETFYGGKWHYLDLDVRAAFRRRDGSLASMADAQKDASLWKGPQGPLFFPLDPLGKTREAYRTTAVHHYYGFHQSGHTMDFMLRQGETFTRWWKPQGGRWNHADDYNEAPFPRQLLEREPRGPKCKHAGWTVHAHGNGRFDYRPNLTDRSTDFADGVYDFANVQPSAKGLTLQRPGEGHAIFEVRSPYVIVPLVGKMETRADDREASVVKLDARGVALSASLDNGLTWKKVDADSGTADLTALAAGTYGYLLKLRLKGRPGEAVVRSLTITTWVQVAPASLPSLRKGKNLMQYRVGDHHGLRSRVIEVRTNGSDRADFLKHCHQPPKDFDPARRTERVRGAFVVKVQAPPRSKIAWLSAGGSFATRQGKAARKTRNAIAYAAGEPKDFKTIYKADVPADQGHWHYNVAREIKLDKPAKTVYLRYTGDPAVNNLHVYAHCVDDDPPAPSPVTITHAWREGGKRKTHTVTLKRSDSYEITVGGEPENESLELRVASVVKP